MNNNVTSKEDLLLAAKEILKEDGVEQISIRRIAKVCNISVGVFYNYFPTKTDLLFALAFDFWSSVYPKEISLADRNIFVEYIGKLYNNLIEQLCVFENGWLKQLSLLNAAQKEQGREIERLCFMQIEKELRHVLEQDEQIPSQIWSEDFRKDTFIKYVFFHLMTMIRTEQKDCNFFLEILRRILYK